MREDADAEVNPQMSRLRHHVGQDQGSRHDPETSAPPSVSVIMSFPKPGLQADDRGPMTARDMITCRRARLSGQLRASCECQR